jgi:hypothetical protein
MKHKTASAKMEQPSAEGRWLLLIHQIPPKPDYLRVKIGRRLQHLGAMAIKNSVYALPRNDDTYEDFQWVAREITEGKGEAFIVEAKFIDGLSDVDVEALFHKAREEDYAAIAKDAQRLRREPADATAANVVRIRKRLSEVAAIDFFGAAGRETAEALVRELEERMEPHSEKKPTQASQTLPRGRTWVTRKGIKVDRIGSAWLIRNFIDKEARFKFVPGQGYLPSKGELRFDMFEAEYTHEGDRCTFEVLLKCFGLEDPALRQLAEVVHDIDLKDGKFGRPETAGLENMLAGLTAANTDDEARLTQGGQLFANLYEYFRRTKSP